MAEYVTCEGCIHFPCFVTPWTLFIISS